MSRILSKKEMSEEDIKRLYITPALEGRWPADKITMETQITDGRVVLKGSKPFRDKPKRADYVLYWRRDYPLAVVEAKDNTHSVSFGLQQAIEYATMMDAPFAYSSNGDGFVERDLLTGKEREFGLDEFPSEAELVERFIRGKGITPELEKVASQPYYVDQKTHSPRYYQRVAVNRTLDAIAQGQERILLAMATGVGKTYTAFQIVYRLLKSGLKKKILYLADRNILVDQSIQQDFAPLEKVVHKINVGKDAKGARNALAAYQVYFALYQQLIGDDETEHFRELFAPDFFDLIIVDECHRGSAKEDSRWRRILEYFSSATQIGLTATPKETKYVSNINYFGEPIYAYSLRQGIDDGFLAPFKVVNITTNIGDEWRPLKGWRDASGELIEDRVYNNADYDYNIVIEDRAREVAEEITRYLRSTDRLAKTIVFCPTEDAAERMRQALVNANSDMVREHPDYVVRITGSDEYGKGKLDYFISVAEPFPTIATTSKLLTTGVDCKMTKLIVLDSCISSMTEFKQIIGRGTRIREKDGKTHFVVMDFRNVTRLFADPDWDGPIEIDEGFQPGQSETVERDPDEDGDERDEPSKEKKAKPIVGPDGCRVEVIFKTVSIYDVDGKLLRQESVVDYARANLLGEYASLDDFIQKWSAEEKKATLRQMLSERGLDLEALKAEQGLAEADDFDFVCHLAFGRKPATRRERAAKARRRDVFAKYGDEARAVLDALLEKYARDGIYEIENIDVLKLEPFVRMGKPKTIVGFFGGKAEYLQAVKELEQAIYADEEAAL